MSFPLAYWERCGESHYYRHRDEEASKRRMPYFRPQGGEEFSRLFLNPIDLVQVRTARERDGDLSVVRYAVKEVDESMFVSLSEESRQQVYAWFRRVVDYASSGIGDPNSRWKESILSDLDIDTETRGSLLDALDYVFLTIDQDRCDIGVEVFRVKNQSEALPKILSQFGIPLC